MPLIRLDADQVYTLWLASPLAFEDWTDIQAAEMNANPTNSPNGLIFNVSCALDTDSSQFDFDEPELDESTTFCQDAGTQNPISQGATVVYSVVRSKERWLDASQTTHVGPGVDGLNTSELAASLLKWRGIEYFAIMRIGKAYDEPVVEGDRLYIAEVATDWGVPVADIGSNIMLQQNFAKRSRIGKQIVPAA